MCAKALTVDQALRLMQANKNIAKAKGDYGEAAAIAVLRDYCNLRGSGTFLLHSFMYPYAKDKHGNIYKGNINYSKGKYVHIPGRDNTNDEIDLLLVTTNRIFAIEVKARTGKWDLFDYWTKQKSTMVDKSPIAQAEKHVRHLYHQIYEYIPDGDPKYIVPLTVFVDKATIVDARNDTDKRLYPVAILNNLKKVIMEYDQPQGYALHLTDIKKRLRNIGKYSEC